jgi:hypothetical protein
VRTDRAVLSEAGQWPPAGRVEQMLRIYFLQQWFNLSNPAVEEALYDSAAMRRFVGIDLGRQPVPDETTVGRFRHLLEAHDLGRRLFDEVQRHLAAKGLKVATGTIVDATIINAPSSTKNADKRDPHAGDLYVFRGRRGHLIKILWHDGIGMSLYAKRLERGRFLWPSPADGIVAISAAQLAYMLDGIDWRNPVRTWRPEAAG